jgi:hypothetical protein
MNCKFNPDGQSFAVCCDFGNVSVYGYGDVNVFAVTPREQFFEVEDMELCVDEMTLEVLHARTLVKV